MDNVKKRGIIAGMICFAAFMIPWIFFVLLSYIYSGGVLKPPSLLEITEVGVFLLVSVFLGFCFTRNLKILKVFSVFFAAVIFIAWMSLLFLS